MSYSSLTTYKAFTPNMSLGRGGKKVIKIAVHHMAGNLSVIQCGNVFRNNRVSAHYGVNGKQVGCYVDESNTAWALGNFDKNQRSINIECANDGGTSTNWHVSDLTIETTINLIVDIAYRLGWTYIAYNGTYAGSDIIMHRWVASTACPGGYLASKMKYIATEADKRLKAKRSTPEPKPKSTISVDGIWGNATTKALQKWLGTTQDGIVSNQLASCKKYLPNCTTASWQFSVLGRGGSAVIKKLQRLIGATSDGYCGKNTVKALQKYLGVTQDGICGANTVKALQNLLNRKV